MAADQQRRHAELLRQRGKLQAAPAAGKDDVRDQNGGWRPPRRGSGTQASGQSSPGSDCILRAIQHAPPPSLWCWAVRALRPRR
jgi:hypothetical protein